MKNKLLVVLAGPTAVGKTALGIKIAEHYNSEIISADSRQLYRELNIGVARPYQSELKAVQHHFIASHSIHKPLNAGEYAKEINNLLNTLFEKNDIVIMVGGTGLYIQAATQGLSQLPKQNLPLREELQKVFADKGVEGLQERLYALDSQAQLKDNQNPQRLIRAIEIISATKMSLANSLAPTESQGSYRCLYLYKDMDREKLYERINNRVVRMMDAGLLEEAKGLFEFRELSALQTVGYQELFDYLENKVSIERALELIQQHSRNYAKRQITWFKNKSYQRIESLEEAILSIEQFIKN